MIHPSVGQTSNSPVGFTGVTFPESEPGEIWDSNQTENNHFIISTFQGDAPMFEYVYQQNTRGTIPEEVCLIVSLRSFRIIIARYC